MSYTPPTGNAVDFQFSGDAYTAPPGDAVAFSFEPVATGTPSATLAGALDITGELLASFTMPAVVGTLAGALDIVGAFGTAHGVAGQAAGALAMAAAVQALHPRYHLAGQVLNEGVLVDRRVRVYSRATGELVAQADTAAGLFDIETGFAPGEYTLLPIDLANDATDWAPPTANRVLSVLRAD